MAAYIIAILVIAVVVLVILVFYYHSKWKETEKILKLLNNTAHLLSEHIQSE